MAGQFSAHIWTSIASGFNLPLKRAKIIDAGSPGINLGMIKFKVKAAKAAIR